MTDKTQPAVKKSNDTKEITKSSKTEIPKNQKCLRATVNRKNGVNNCSLLMDEDDASMLAQSTGCKVYYAAMALIKSGMNAVMGGIKEPVAMEEANNNYLAMMAELKPQDAFEGMLVSQMGVTYMQAMETFRLTGNNKESSLIFERLQNQGIKLMRLYNQQLETLDKHRRKGNQKMTVEHVNIHKGGQAIVGNVTQGGGATDEK